MTCPSRVLQACSVFRFACLFVSSWRVMFVFVIVFCVAVNVLIVFIYFFVLVFLFCLCNGLSDEF